MQNIFDLRAEAPKKLMQLLNRLVNLLLQKQLYLILIQKPLI
jgi:hypothetical protein